MRKQLFILAVAIASAAACSHTPDDSRAADNTARNKRDHAITPTADNAVKNAADLDLTQKIRKAIVDDGTLSMNAHNCKIVVQDGAVTLAGPVASDTERARVEEIATTAAGYSVSNQLEVIDQPSKGPRS